MELHQANRLPVNIFEPFLPLGIKRGDRKLPVFELYLESDQLFQ